MEQQEEHHSPKVESKPRTNSNPTPDAKPGGSDDDIRSTNDEDAKEQPNPPDADAAARTLSSRKSVKWNPELVSESPPPPLPIDDEGTVQGRAVTGNSVYVDGSNPYVSSSPASPANTSFSFKETVVSVKDALGRWRKKVGEATRKAEDLAGNTWQHLKTAPSFTDGALGRIAQGAKVLAEGGYEKIFQQTFETDPEEQLQNSFACYLSTSAGPVMGIMYVSTAKVAFCSDAPLSYKSSGQTEWSYYKVVIPLHQLKAVIPSSSKTNPAEKYIQVISVDNHEFWLMGFLNYNNALNILVDTLQAHGNDVRAL